MATIIQLPLRKERTKVPLKNEKKGSAEILFFSGVRYTRCEDIVEEARRKTVKRRRKGLH